MRLRFFAGQADGIGMQTQSPLGCCRVQLNSSGRSLVPLLSVGTPCEGAKVS
jgi:hypothetical protein